MLNTLRLLGAGIFLACVPQSSLAQSDETCIAYMEAFANYQAHQKRIYEKHQPTITAAYKRAQAIESAAYKRKRALRAPESWNVEIPLPENNPQYKAAHAAKNEELNLAKRAYGETLLKVYDGPRSTSKKVMWSLIGGDIQRCHHDGFFVSN